MKKKQIGIFCIFLILPIGLIFAGNTGKIAGMVTDAETGAPLPGVNVVLSGTDMGAATDLSGHYTILNIPVGEYTVRAQMIGYKIVEVTGSKVSVDLTTRVDMQLEPTVIEGELVTVEAVHPMVQMDLTSSRRTMSSDDIIDMPVESVEQAVSLTAGAVQSGGLHLRGGRASEVVYLLDGIPLNDPLTGNPNDSDIPVMAVDEADVISGGFGAEYGGAQSGIINVTSKEGTNHFSGKVRLSTSNGVSDYFNNEDPEDIKKIEFNFSGPIIPQFATFFVSGEVGEDYGRFRNQFSDLKNFTGKLTLKPTKSVKLTFTGLWSRYEEQDGFDYSWSQVLNEDKLTQYIPSYLQLYDGELTEVSNGIISSDEIPDFYSNWLVTDGLQTEDTDGDGNLDRYYESEPYADWNGNGQWDTGEWYDDLNGSGAYDASLNWDADGDGDNLHEDFNDNGKLDMENSMDFWYGNGQLDTEDINGNGILDDGEDLNGNGILDSEDVDKNGSITTYSMFDRLPYWRRESSMMSFSLTHTISEKTFYILKIAQYSTGLKSNIIERLNEDTDGDGHLDIYWATETFEDLNGDGKWDEGEWYADLNGDGTYNLHLDWDMDGDGDKRNEDLNGNGILDTYTPQKDISGFDDPQDMFHDENSNDYVDESERDWDGDGDVDKYDRTYFWMAWDDIPDEGFKNTVYFYGLGGGHPYTFLRDHWHNDIKKITFLKLDLVSQTNPHHKISTGFDFRFHDLNNFWPPDRYGYAENYTVNPKEFSFYFSDKMEYPGLIINAGLRLEQFDPNHDYPADESDPTWTSDDEDDWDGDGESEPYKVWEDNAGLYIHSLDDLKNPKSAKKKIIWAPRLGISHPITDKSMLYFNYGRYFQRPALAYMFRNINYDMGGGFPIVGNPNMDPELTTSYEVGIRNEVARSLLIEVKGFYKDIFGLTDTRPIYWTVSDWYTSYYNRDYGNVRGFELIIAKRPPSLIYGEINYTYSIAKGKSSTVGQGYLTEWSGNIVPTFESFLDWDQTHTFNAILTGMLPVFFTPINDLLRATLVISYGSGIRYTKPEQGRIILENTETLPPVIDSDLRLNYDLKIGSWNGTIFVLISNLFNIEKNFNRVSDIQWYHTYKTLKEDYDDGKLTLNEYMEQVDLNHDGKVDKNKKYSEKGPYLNPGVYWDKRRFQVGISLSF